MWGAAADAGPSFGYDAMPPSCSVGPEGGVCACLDLSLLGEPPNLYFVLDRSGSMLEANKWQTVRSVVIDVMRALGPRAKFGAAVFPAPGGASACSAGVEVMAPRLGDVPAGAYGMTSALFTRQTDITAEGGTPTAATLAALTPKLVAYSGKTFVILATDGAPNCNANAACDVDGCTLNIDGTSPGCAPNVPPNCCASAPASCVDETPTLDAVSALHARRVDTYVVGVPGSAAYASLLDAIATAGGTARPGSPRYYAVDTTDAAALATALTSIAAKITATCTLPLADTPPDPAMVNVYLDGAVVPADPIDGWRVDGATVTLLGKTCARVLAGDALAVRVVAGCPTVLR